VRCRLPVAIALALAGDVASAQQGPAAFAESVLEVTINGEHLPGALLVRRDTDGALLVRASDLKALRLKTPPIGAMLVNGQRYYRIGREIGATVTFDDATQSVDLSLPPQAFIATNGRYASSADTPAKVATQLGAFFNYDASAERTGGNSSVGGFLEFGLFGAKGVLTATALAQADARGAGGTRLDAAWTRDFPDRMVTLRIGDAISTAGAWGRSVRFGGVQYGTNFSTQPTLVTTPLLSASGEALVPSTVDVFVNGQPVASQQVRPGPFQIDGVPAVNGAGQMQVVVTDALGRQQVVSQPYYAGTALLRPGLDEYSMEAGAVRRNYARRSNDYANFVGAATFSRGLTSELTVGAHAEAQSRGAAAAGADGALQVGMLGIVTAAAAAGGDQDGRGWLGGLGFERSGPRLSLYARGLYASQGFAQLGDNVLQDQPKLRAFGGLGLNLMHYGSLQFAYGLQTNWLTPSVETLGLGYSLGLGALGFVNLFASHSTAETSSSDVFLTWTVPFGDRRTGSATLRRSSDPTGKGDEFEAVAAIQQSLPVGTGSGYTASISSSDQAHVGYSYQGRAGAVGVDVARANGQEGVRVGGTGGVAITSAGVMPSRRLDQSFAVVQVADYPNVEVFVNNQSVGRTDPKGRVLLDNLLPYQENRVSVDPNKLPMDATVSTSSMTVTPAYRSGLVAKFPISRADAVTLRLLQPGGQPVPAGAEIKVGGQGFPVAMNGSVYLTGLAKPARAVVTWRDGSCSFGVFRPAGTDPIPDLGAVICVPDPAKGAHR
jgi:outer membrane usher protein